MTVVLERPSAADPPPTTSPPTWRPKGPPPPPRTWLPPVDLLPRPEPVVEAPRASRIGRPLLAVLYGYPLLWVLGLQSFSWIIVSFIVLGSMIAARNRIVLPRGFGIWLLFMSWVALSFLEIHEIGRLEAALYRAFAYLSGTILMIFVINVGERVLSTRSLVLGIMSLWYWSIGLAIVAFIVPTLRFTSPVGALLPASIAKVSFVDALVNPRFGTVDLLIGVTRPTPLYQYTNSWGAVVGIMTPIVIYGWTVLRTRWAKIGLIFGLTISLIPIIVSINRGLWISIVVAVAWVLLRRLGRGDFTALVIGVGDLLAMVSAVLFTPLGDIFQERLAKPNQETRQTLYDAALQAVNQSPFFGFGSPINSTDVFGSGGISIGTHGQFWTVLVCQGYPGEIFFCAFFIAMIILTWKTSDKGLWLHSVLVVGFVQIFFYDHLPAGICIYAIGLGLTVRDCVETEARRAAAEAAKPFTPPPIGFAAKQRRLI